MKSLKFATQQNHDHKFLLVKFLHFCVFQSPERRWNLSLPKWLLNLSTYPHYMCVSVTQLCPTLCDPMDCSPPGSVHGILQARILQWLTVPFSRESSWPRDRTRVTCIADRFFIAWATRDREPLYEGFIKIQYPGLHSQNFWLSEYEMDPKNLSF